MTRGYSKKKEQSPDCAPKLQLFFRHGNGMSLSSSLISGQLAAELKATGSTAEELKTSWALIRDTEEKHVRRLVNFPIRRGWMFGCWLGNGQKTH
jgi:hypothetical protein